MGALTLLPVSKRPYKADPRIVVICACCFLLSCKSLQQFWQLGVMEVVLLFLAVLSGTSLVRFFLTSLLVLPFTLAAVPLWFTVEGTVWFEVLGLTASWQGLEKFTLVFLHTWICYQVLILASALTGPFAFVEALGRLGLPRRLVEMLQLTLRYLDLLLEEARRMNRARICRGGEKKQPLLEAIRGSSYLVASLFLRTWDRAERVQLAMRCRGHGKPLSRHRCGPSPTSHWIAVLALVILTGWILSLHV